MRTKTPPRAGMIAAWEAIAQFVIDVRYVGITLLYLNVLWVLCSLPVITAPAATAALYVTTRDLTHRREISWRAYLRACQTYFFTGWRWVLMNAIAGGIVYANLTFYSYMPPPFGPLLIALWLGAVVVWLMVQMYCFPVMLEQEKWNVRQALRNALVLVLRHPFFTLTYALVAGFFAFISLIIPYLWLLITTALFAFLYNGAVRYLVQVERGATPELEIERF
ncbi:MAG: DUF624 domain-containing protein [Anaerolineae bacterium]|nr:DUF624 domain-containing protein [Anaerolineae bacterium]